MIGLMYLLVVVT